MSAQFPIPAKGLAHRLLRAAQTLFAVNAIIWIALGVLSMARAYERNPAQSLTIWIIAVLMFGNAAAMGVAGWTLPRRGIWTIFALAVLVINIVLTFTDQVGFLDIATLFVDLAILGCWAGSLRLHHPRG
jgi:hypothetical protein